MNIAIVGMSNPKPVSVNWRESARRVVNLLDPKTRIVSGGAKGIDSFVEEAIREHGGFPVPIIMRADWDRYGKSAGPIRNSEIVKQSDAVIAFWDYRSPGTADTIIKARKAGKPVFIVDPATKDGDLLRWLLFVYGERRLWYCKSCKIWSSGKTCKCGVGPDWKRLYP